MSVGAPLHWLAHAPREADAAAREHIAETTHLTRRHAPQRVAVACAAVALLLASLALSAWATGHLALASVRTAYIPMAPSTALAFVLINVGIVSAATVRSRVVAEAVRGGSMLVFILATIKLIEFFSGVTIVNFEAELVAEPARFGAVPLARMSPLTAGALLLAAIALVCLTIPGAPLARNIGGALGTGTTLAGSTVVLGYAYGAPLLYGGTVIPMALTTGLAFVATGLALVALAGPSALPLRPFYSGARRAEAAEAQHRDLQERAAFALAAAGAGVWELDLGKGTVLWSETLSAMLGLPSAPVLTTLDGFRQRVHPEDWPTLDAAVTEAIEEDVPYRVLFRTVWPDGTTRWINSKGHVTRDRAGNPVGVLGISLDVTDRKELELRIQQAQRLEALGRVTGSIAHDFNNVLTAIFGFSELLGEHLRPSDPHAGDVAEIKKAAESGRALVRRLLAFSRQQTLTPTRLDVNDVIGRAAPMIRQLLGRGVELDIALEERLGAIWADPGQIEQILLNLATNARDAMPNGGRVRIATCGHTVTPQVAAREQVKPGPYLLLTIADEGVGMSQETQARMFEPFFTTKAPDKGTGLGLSTIYGIVRQSGGFVTVTSAPGVGTTFHIHLPLLQGDEPLTARV